MRSKVKYNMAWSQQNVYVCLPERDIDTHKTLTGNKAFNTVEQESYGILNSLFECNH